MTIKHIGLLNIQRCDSHGAVWLAYAMEHFLLDLLCSCGFLVLY